MNATNTQTARRSVSSKLIFQVIRGRIKEYRLNAGHKDSRIVMIHSPVALGPVQVIFQSPAERGTRKTFTVLPDGSVTPPSYWCEGQI